AARFRRAPPACRIRASDHSRAPHLRASGRAVDGNLRGTGKVKIFVFGSSLTSSYWNGAATYYRGIYKNLHALGHRITFAEPDIYSRQQHRDVAEINYADVLVYNSPADIARMLSEACSADLVIKHSGVGA